jgi:hypothetical protein
MPSTFEVLASEGSRAGARAVEVEVIRIYRHFGCKYQYQYQYICAFAGNGTA